MNFLDNDVLGLATVYDVLIIIHILGIALGAGAAFFSDFLFTNTLKDGKIDRSEFRILAMASKIVWLGLGILLTSGLIIFIGDYERLLDSSKFLAKMSIILVLVINGITFHFKQIPELQKLQNKKLSTSKQFKEMSTPFFIGGAVSGVSWMAALVLGALRFVDLSYFQIMAIYIAVLIPAILASLMLKKHYTK